MNNHRVFLGLGSNLGDKQKNIERAYREIEKRVGNIVSSSAFYATDPVGFISSNSFVNSVCEVVTGLDLFQLLHETQQIEKKIGRTQKSDNGKYADRLLDIDILMYDNLTFENEELTVPHPNFHLRCFVLNPFAEISPDTVHPVLNKKIGQLKKEMDNH